MSTLTFRSVHQLFLLLLSISNQWISSYQSGLYTEYISLNSHRRITILHPIFLISTVLKNLVVHVKFPRNSRKQFPSGNTLPLLLFRRNHNHRAFLLLSKFSLLTCDCHFFSCPANNFPISGGPSPVR